MLQDATSLDEYIAGFYEEGTLDSRGQFTVDLARRAEKLEKYQLLNPERFVLPWLAGATAGGARHFRFQRRRDGFSLHFDGQPLEGHSGLQAVLERSAVDLSQPRSRALSCAMLLAAQLQLGRVSLRGGGACLVLERNGCRLESYSGPDNELRVEGSLWSLLFRSRTVKISRAVEGILRKRGYAAPGMLRLEDEVVRPNWIRNPKVGLAINDGARSEFYGRVEILGRLRLPQPVHGLLLLGGEEPGEATLVTRGVAFPIPLKRNRLSGYYQIVLWCDELVADLTHENLVQDELYGWLMRNLACWMVELELACLSAIAWREGLEGLLERPGAARTLWSYRQQALHSLSPPEVEWPESAGPRLALTNLGGHRTLATAAQVYAELHWLPISDEAGLCLDDGRPIFQKTPSNAALLDMLFPVQRKL